MILLNGSVCYPYCMKWFWLLVDKIGGMVYIDCLFLYLDQWFPLWCFAQYQKIKVKGDPLSPYLFIIVGKAVRYLDQIWKSV